MVGAVAERMVAVLRVAGSINSWDKYLYGLQRVVCVCTNIYVCNGTHDTLNVCPSVGHRFYTYSLILTYTNIMKR